VAINDDLIESRPAMFSLIIPVYRNEASIGSLVKLLEELNNSMSGDLEVVLVVDGSPDGSLDLLAEALPGTNFDSQLLALSRNFGSYNAITAGLASARGNLFATMSADLQEPAELITDIRKQLETGKFDVVVGSRVGRDDPIMSRILANIFWKLYKLFIQREIPRGGIDVFGCNQQFREHLLSLRERNTMLIGLIFWLGFRRGQVTYRRARRTYGKSAWSFARKFRYLLDSTFAFTDLPVRLLSLIGLLGITLAIILAAITLFVKWTGRVPVPGYSATVLLIMFFGGLNSLGLGLIGEYVWRTFENTKGRPGYVVARHLEFDGNKKGEWTEKSRTTRG